MFVWIYNLIRLKQAWVMLASDRQWYSNISTKRWKALSKICQVPVDGAVLVLTQQMLWLSGRPFPPPSQQLDKNQPWTITGKFEKMGSIKLVVGLQKVCAWFRRSSNLKWNQRSMFSLPYPLKYEFAPLTEAGKVGSAQTTHNTIIKY